jgi:hypothetical protein
MSQRFTGASVTASSISLSGTGSFTVCAWTYVQNATAGDFCYMDTAGGSAGNDDIWLGFAPTSYRFQNRHGGVGPDVTVAMTLNQWHHAAMTYDGTNTTCYVDGAVVSGPTATTLTGRTAMNFLGMGGGGDFTVQDVMVFASALTAAQIQYVMARQAPPVAAYAQYKLANASPTTDSTGNGHTLSGGGNSNGLQILAAADGTTLMKGSNIVVPGISAVTANGTVLMKGSNIVVPGIAAITATGTVLMNGSAVVTSSGGGATQITATGTTLMTGSAAVSGVAAITAAGTTLMKGVAAAAGLAAIAAAGNTLMTGTAQTTGGVNPFPNPGTPSHIRRVPASLTGRRSTRR